MAYGYTRALSRPDLNDLAPTGGLVVHVRCSLPNKPKVEAAQQGLQFFTARRQRPASPQAPRTQGSSRTAKLTATDVTGDTSSEEEDGSDDDDFNPDVDVGDVATSDEEERDWDVPVTGEERPSWGADMMEQESDGDSTSPEDMDREFAATVAGKGKATKTSKGKGKATDPKALFDDNQGVTTVGGASNPGKRKASKGRSRKPAGESHREKKRRYEEPTFDGSDVEHPAQDGTFDGEAGGAPTSEAEGDAVVVADQSASDHDDFVNPDPPPHVGYPGWSDLVLNAAGKASLTLQDPRVRKAVNLGIAETERFLAFETPFPEVDGNKRAVLRSCLARGAGKVEPVLVERIIVDTPYAKLLVDHLANRVSHYRGDYFKAAVQWVPSAYGLRRPDGRPLPPSQTRERVKQLTEGRKYVYLMRESHEIEPRWRHAYEHPCLALVIQSTAFVNTNSPGIRHPDLFVSTLADDYPEPEVPEGMLALAATAVLAVLNCYATGAYIPSTFHIDAGATAFLDHMECFAFMKKKGGPVKHHKMLAGILKTVREDVNIPMGSAQEDVDMMDFGDESE
ncbi:hypothetical protein EIP91_009253 [Steccherinum ochraceum]|uniref:DUF6532 domain-containing protein n=1 Tax=Steccherinum ochraceum TaxID=92696 RepID=A0A4V2MV41_9APHY|nr:hypothetical protein EIP91_009253 [Steccherinum ochraceum]